jgi:hypothetical protein
MRKILVYTLALLLLLAGALWWNIDHLAQQVVRPWLVERIQERLLADVSIEFLEFDHQRLLLRQVHLAGRDGLTAQVAEIEVVFSLGGLLRRHLTGIVVRLPELRVESVALGKGPRQTSAGLPEQAPLRIDHWALEAGSLQLVLPERVLNLHDIVAQGSLGPEFRFALQALLGEDPAVAFQVNGQGEWLHGPAISLAELIWDGQSLLPEAVTFRPGGLSASGFRLSFPRLDSFAVEALLVAVGEDVPWPDDLTWHLSDPDLSVQLDQGGSRLQLKAHDGFVQTGKSQWPWQQVDVQAAETDNVWRVSAAVALTGASRLQLVGQWTGQAFAGEGQFSSQQPDQLASRFQLAVPAGLADLQKLSVTARFKATAGALEVRDGRIAGQWPQYGDLKGKFSGQWQENAVAANFDQLSLSEAGKPLAKASLRVIGDLAADRWQGAWTFVCADPMPLVLQAGLAVPPEAPLPGGVELSGNLGWRDRRLTLTKIKMQSDLRGEGLSAALSGQLDIVISPERDVDITLQQLSLTGVEYTNAAGTIVASGGSLSVSADIKLGGSQYAFRLRGQAALAEALLGSWYGELHDLPVEFSGAGYWKVADGILFLDNVELDAAGLATASLHGRASADHLQLRGRLGIDRLAGAFLKVVQRFGKDLLPGIDQLELAGGLSMEGAFVLDAPDWSLDLSLQPQGVSFVWGDALHCSDLSGRFPVQLRHGDRLPAPVPATGSLQWAHLATKLIEAPQGKMLVDAFANRLELRAPLEATSVGGKLRLNRLMVTMEDVAPQALASMQVLGLDLAQLAKVLGWPEMAGQLNASLDDIRFSQDEIVTTGRASAEAFGGMFELHNLKIQAPFSRYPTYHADIAFSGLDLHELTQTFAFGEINGVADGFVRGLRLFDGVPSDFEARFETRLEGTRNISVKAIRNLNTLSQGGLSSALSQGVYRFIDFYRYRKIGLVCSLHADLFHVTGVSREGSEQYLVDGGMLPPKIDVIMSSPTISFREMVRRLKRMERTGH